MRNRNGPECVQACAPGSFRDIVSTSPHNLGKRKKNKRKWLCISVEIFVEKLETGTL
jgi:hypothetical protein